VTSDTSRLHDILISGGSIIEALASEWANRIPELSQSQSGLLSATTRYGIIISLLENISEQIGSINDIQNSAHRFIYGATFNQQLGMLNSFAASAQAVAVNVLMDYFDISDASTLIYGNSGHVTGSQVFQLESAAANTLATEELRLPVQIENSYMNLINAVGNRVGADLYNAFPSWFP
jgi:hypothetical protein